MPRRGTRILVPKPQDVIGQLMVREALECQAARMYCGAIIQQASERIMSLARESDQYNDNRIARLKTDQNLHQSLVELSGCQTLIKHYGRVASMWRFYDMALASKFASIPDDFHVDMCEDLCEMDPDDAADRIRLHIRAGKEQLFQNA